MDSTIKKLFIKIGIYSASVIALFLVFEIARNGINNELLVPNFLDICDSFFELLGTSKTYLYIGNTLLHLLISLLISFVIGILLGVLAGLNKYVKMFLNPWFAIMKSIPVIVTIGVIMIITSYLSSYRLSPYFVACLLLIPIVYEGVSNGISSIDKTYVDAWKLESNMNIRVIFKIYLPLILSHIKTAIFLAIGMGIKVILMVEYIVGYEKSLGYALVPATYNLEYAQAYAYCVIIVLLVLLLEFLPKAVFSIYQHKKYSIPWLKKEKSVV